MHPYANPILYVPVEFPDQEQDGDDLFKQAVLSTETDVALQEEIETLSKRTDADGPVPAMPQSKPDTDSETEIVPEAKRVKDETGWLTLCGVLQRAGLLEYKPGSDDNEEKLLKRVRSMCPFMRALSAVVRTEEGILTRAQVHGGVTQTFRRNNLAEHLLAEARAEFHCSAEKQTRHGLWRQYVEKIEALCTEEEDGTTPGAMQPVKFRLHIWCVFFV